MWSWNVIFTFLSVPSGFPQSLSGSETDVSTSNENLSREERYVVRHTARVEPQGQENQSQTNNNNRNSLKVFLFCNKIKTFVRFLELILLKNIWIQHAAKYQL